ncbi:calcium/calmodulin-dependent protein kinase I [Fistulifera solaris]|uniref:non-specific serine/threonine protein kinase n=1 Tax=Fistulifera solaris TaxID=1519565 RepID=A0A1Z5K3F2_FISSO|nr:calcium/calmodulin-dependent protein kinase I [Fistulifera solaris]|eukprot:GAX20770.1 calcium/calmodulin-dependent protein kinase I [Fistulifera solaris]
MGCGGSKETGAVAPSKKSAPPPESKDQAAGTNFGKQYRLGKELGSGAFSTVKEGFHKETKEAYAVKIVTKSKLTYEDEAALKDEISVLKELNHPNIIRLYDVFEEKDYYFLVTEKMMGGELFDRIVQKSYYNEKEARDTALVLFQAISFCHQKKIAHRDLKPENLLLTSTDSDSNIKIADFGFAKKCPKPNSLTTQCGTPGYVAPEILEGTPYDMQADMWSLGVIVYIILGGYPPFMEQNQRELFRKIRKGQYQFHVEYWGQVSEDAKDLIRSLLVVKPSARYTATHALSNKWITGDANSLKEHDLADNLKKLKAFNAKRKMKAAVKAVMATQKLNSLGVNLKEILD